MINRYGPWMDTNLLLPLGPRKCLVVFDYFLNASLKDDESFIQRSLKESEQVQIKISSCVKVFREDFSLQHITVEGMLQPLKKPCIVFIACFTQIWLHRVQEWRNRSL
ncbi:hypothetical protein Droror1_Dr00008882 [Drosera rotundifolia]